MALVFEANYSKKLGLPGYSSHQYSLTIRAELSDITKVEEESARLYALLQSSVDREIQETGFLPNCHANGNGNGNGHAPEPIPTRNGKNEVWQCSEKQKVLILRVVEENRLEKSHVEQLSQDRFSKGVRQLNRLEASGLIEELFEQTGQKRNGKPFAKGGGR